MVKSKDKKNHQGKLSISVPNPVASSSRDDVQKLKKSSSKLTESKANLNENQDAGAGEVPKLKAHSKTSLLVPRSSKKLVTKKSSPLSPIHESPSPLVKKVSSPSNTTALPTDSTAISQLPLDTTGAEPPTQDDSITKDPNSEALGEEQPQPNAEEPKKCGSKISKRCIPLKKVPWVIYVNSKNPHLKHPGTDPNSTRKRGESIIDPSVYTRILFEIKGSRSSARNLAEWEAARNKGSTNNILVHSMDPCGGCKNQVQTGNETCEQIQTTNCEAVENKTPCAEITPLAQACEEIIMEKCAPEPTNCNSNE